LAENRFPDNEKRMKVRGPLTGLWRIAVYYVALFATAYVLAQIFPVFHEVVFGGFERLSRAQPVGTSLNDSLVPDALNATPMATLGQGQNAGRVFAVLAAVSLLGALALMIPVAWVYLLTKQRRGYDESVVQAMLILPIAVAGIVFIVQFNLALAFSLAGAAAAVRFRSTLKDTKDAVYVFLGPGSSGNPLSDLQRGHSLPLVVQLREHLRRPAEPYRRHGAGRRSGRAGLGGHCSLRRG
jgi:hypothetical protein